MNLKPIASNMTELTLKGGLVVLFSYQTPVACHWTNGLNQVFYKTEKFWSRTTSRHINKWLIQTDNWTDRKIEEKPQKYFDELVA